MTSNVFSSASLPSSRLAGSTLVHGFPSKYMLHLSKAVAFSLEHEHDWSDIKIHMISPLDGSTPLARPLISGKPKVRVYVHPDDQVEELAREKRGEKVNKVVEREWVLPTQIREKWSLKKFAECFDAVGQEPPVGDDDADAIQKSALKTRRGGKRMLLATLHDDSTVVYYVVHDGLVKPRQN